MNNRNHETCTYLTRRIGSTTYKVKVHFCENAAETMEDKIFRMIRNEALESQKDYVNMDVPQMGRPPERSAS